jgi:hypothetical protein
MRPPQQPYRAPHPGARAPDRTDGLAGLGLAAHLFLLAWSLLRVTLCAVRGPDFEGLLAALVIALVLGSLFTRSHA